MAQTKRERNRERNGKNLSSEFLTRRQIADLLGISVWTLIWWRRMGRGPEFVKIGPSTVRYPRQKFERWLASLPRG